MKMLFRLCVVTLAFQVTSVWGQQASGDFAKGKVFLKVRDGLGLQLETFMRGQPIPEFEFAQGLKGVLVEHGATALFKPFKTQAEVLQNTYELHVGLDSDLALLVESLEGFHFVEYAEPVAIHRMHYTPNDQSFFQWHLNKISAPSAWDICRGTRNVVVAVVDDAVKLNHADLTAQIWTNPGEIAGDSIDNDGNGWIDDIHGFDLAENDNDPSPPSGANNSSFSHGTHVAGIAAASTDNGTGIASVGFNVSIMPCKVKLDSTIADPELQFTYYGVDYAIANKANVVNMSFGGAGYNATFANLLAVGRDSGMVFVASAGNTGSYSIQYPAGYTDAISVASSASSDALSGFSTYHPSVDVTAPGSNIYSSTAGSPTSYGFMSGTSMSAPVVSGLLALMASLDSSATPLTLRACLESSTDNIDAQNQDKIGLFGTGRVNALKALQCLMPVSNNIPGVYSFSMGLPNPNPSQGEFSAYVFCPQSGNLEVRLWDMWGRVCWSQTIPVTNASEVKLSVANNQLPAGMFRLECRLDGLTCSRPVLVQR
jgi:subtilisin family serine protease